MIQVNKDALSLEVITPYFEQWEQLSKQIFEAHDQRNGEAAPLMVEGIQLFEKLVINSSITNSTEMLREEYEVLPVNGLERLAFIKSRPGQYACFRQLDELFKEIKKKMARLRVK